MQKLILALFLLASCGGEPPPPPPPPPPPAAPKGPERNVLIATAKNFDRKDYLVPGYVTVLMIYNEGVDETAMRLLPYLETLLARHPKTLLRRVDILNWNSDATAQARKEFNMGVIPLLCIFDGKGNQVGRVTGGDITQIDAAVEKALKP